MFWKKISKYFPWLYFLLKTFRWYSFTFNIHHGHLKYAWWFLETTKAVWSPNFIFINVIHSLVVKHLFVYFFLQVDCQTNVTFCSSSGSVTMLTVFTACNASLKWKEFHISIYMSIYLFKRIFSIKKYTD